MFISIKWKCFFVILIILILFHNNLSVIWVYVYIVFKLQILFCSAVVPVPIVYVTYNYCLFIFNEKKETKPKYIYKKNILNVLYIISLLADVNHQTEWRYV